MGWVSGWLFWKAGWWHVGVSARVAMSMAKAAHWCAICVPLPSPETDRVEERHRKQRAVLDTQEMQNLMREGQWEAAAHTAHRIPRGNPSRLWYDKLSVDSVNAVTPWT